MRTAALGEVTEIVSGATPKTGVEEFWGGDIQWATPADLGKLDGPYISETPRALTEAGVRSCATTVLPAGSVLLSARAPIGHVAINTVPMATNQGFKSLVPGPSLDAKYLYHWLKSKTAYLQSLGNGATFKELSKKTAEQIAIPLPPLPEQRRIAMILDHADALRAKRRQVLAHLDSLPQAIFHSMFAEVSLTRTQPLADLAQVSSGITKGRRTAEPASPVPYLAVSNVQAGYLKLDVVKEVGATTGEIARYALRQGDVVLTEGGDPDKLGRGTVWRGEIPLCLHQNHIFRVRVHHDGELLPDYLSAYLASPLARTYFLRSAKQTTGIASINMTQLRALPVAVPPKSEQASYISKVRTITRQRDTELSALAVSDGLMSSLQSRAFRGEL